jgi:3',5'-cyclic AMP phosphodiesterase CpdA
MRARRSEFAEAKAFLDRLRAPFLAVPGNHDITFYRPIERFLRPYRRWQTYISPLIEPRWLDNEIAVLGVNTARPIRLHWNWSHGSISHKQMDRVRAELEHLPGYLFRIIVAHHPFLAPGDAEHTRLVGRSALAMEMFARSGANLILSGHLHLGYQRSFNQQPNKPMGPESMALRADNPIIVLHASTATSTRLRGNRNAYNLLSIDRGALTVTVREWDGAKWQDSMSTGRCHRQGS